MAALVIESFPDALHAKLREAAAAHQRSIPQETIHLLESALAVAPIHQESASPRSGSYLAKRKLLPDYETLLKAGKLASNTDCTVALSEERDAR